MARSLSDLRQIVADKPPRWCLYGPPKIGKTTLAAEFPNPVFIQTEDGVPAGVELTSFPADDYREVMQSIDALRNEEHEFQTLVVDSLSAFEPMVWAEVCRRNKWPSIEAPGFGKGYVEADMIWLEFMDEISGLRRDKSMAILLIAHSEIKRIEHPIVGPLDRFSVQLHKRAIDIIHKDVDVIAFIDYRISVTETKGKFNTTHRKGIGAGERVIHFADRPGFVAGNRYSLPDEVDYRPGEGFAAIAEHMPGLQVAEKPAPARRRQKEAA